MTTWKDKSLLWFHNGVTYVKVTDHNRGAVTVDTERLGSENRMVDGTMRRQTVAKKRTWTVDWKMLPSANDHPGGMTTVDLGMSGQDIESFYNTTDGSFNMKVTEGDGTQETVLVMLTTFSKVIVKRGLVDFWDVSLTIVEA